jgi:hypothetical protein
MTEPRTMDTMKAAAGEAVAEKTLLRLVRQIMQAQGEQPGAGCRVETGDDGAILVGPERRSYPQDALRQALSLGVVQRTGDVLSATAQARGFLRRAMLAGEEAFADQHRDTVAATVELDGGRQAVRRNLNESPLAGLGRLKGREGQPFFPVEAIDAGERLLADFTRAQLQPRLTSSWEPRLSARAKGEAGGMADIAATAVEGRRRFAGAMQAMGPELAGVAADVCCFGKGLELVERERQWPARSAKLLLRAALLALARHYAPPARPMPARVRHWGSEDFRPDADAYGTRG